MLGTKLGGEGMGTAVGSTTVNPAESKGECGASPTVWGQQKIACPSPASPCQETVKESRARDLLCLPEGSPEPGY